MQCFGAEFHGVLLARVTHATPISASRSATPRPSIVSPVSASLTAMDATVPLACRVASRHDPHMKRVFLLRHAKSSWKQRGVFDHDRALAPRGRHAAKAIARHLLEQGIEPELVLCSTAQRARETFERIEPVLGTPVVRFEQELYGASAGVLLDRLQGVGNAVGSVLLIGHNPCRAAARARPRPCGARVARGEGEVPDRRARDACVPGLELASACTRYGRAHRLRAATRPRAIAPARPGG